MRFNGPPSHPVSSRVFVFLIQVAVEVVVVLATTATAVTTAMVDREDRERKSLYI